MNLVQTVEIEYHATRKKNCVCLYFSDGNCVFVLLDHLQSPKRVARSHGDTDCGSDGGEQDQDQEDGGYLSGAESDSGLVDTRQSMNLVVRNLQVNTGR